MISQAISDLYSKLQAIPALATGVGLVIGGQAPDPGMTKVALPAAWVVHEGATNTQAIAGALPPRVPTVHMGFYVLLLVAYTSQQDLIANQLPLLEQVILAIHGTTAPSGQRWFWKASKLQRLNADRLGYRIQFALDSILN